MRTELTTEMMKGKFPPFPDGNSDNCYISINYLKNCLDFLSLLLISYMQSMNLIKLHGNIKIKNICRHLRHITPGQTLYEL